MLPIVSCLICIAFFIAAGVGVYFFRGIYIFPGENTYLHVIVDPYQTIFETDERFLSVALDTSFMGCLFHKLNESEWEMLEDLSRLLSPAYLRLGGTMADQAVFSIHVNESHYRENCEEVPPNDSIVITGADWIKINDFAKKSGFNLIMDLNVLLRSDSGWNSSNAHSLIKFSAENGFHMDFQLGNEPNSFPHVFNVTLSGAELAKDFYNLRQLLNSFGSYQHSKLIGPDVTRPKHLESSSLKYLREFLEGESSVDVVSWHQYYLNGRTAIVEDFVKPETFDLLSPQIESILKVVNESDKKLPIWISETSSAYGGGAPGISNRFAASFLWLDKLGVAAKSNMSVVVRQSLFKDKYALINSDFTPSPDFWISFFYKNLVGRRVLNVKVMGNNETLKYLRFYGHCLSPNSKINGTFVIFGMNLSNDTVTLVATPTDIEYPIYSFLFQAEYRNLKAKSVLLNGEPLVYTKSTVHDWLNKSKEVRYPLISPSYSIGFWVFKELSGKICAS